MFIANEIKTFISSASVFSTAKRRVIHMTLLFMLFALTLTASDVTHSKGVYQTGPDFIAEYLQPSTLSSKLSPTSTSSPTPQPSSLAAEQKSLWLTPELKETASDILGRRVRGIRVRYWTNGEKTAWIMEEIGKELPITIGVIVNGSKEGSHIEHVKILAFRESRGWEVRYPAFTTQYQNVKITPELKLDQHIDGITGATLSVRAVTKVARLALFYHQQALEQ